MEVINNILSSTPYQGDQVKVRSRLDFSTMSRPIDEMSIEPREWLVEKAPVKLKKATVLDMVIEAINTVGVPRKGASYQSIKKWITECKEIDSRRLKFFLKIALKKGIDQGILVKPLHSFSAESTLGFYKIAKTKPVTSSKTYVKKAVNKTSATNADKIPAKSAKPSTKNIKRLYKQPEAEKNLVKASSKAKATNPPPKKVEKKPSRKAAATEHPTSDEPSEAEKPVKKAAVEKKAATKKHATEVLSKPEAEKPPKKAPSKPAVEKKPAKKAAAMKRASADAPLKVAVAKKYGKKAPAKVAVAKKPTKRTAAKKPASEEPSESEAKKATTEGPSKTKALKTATAKKTAKKVTAKKPNTKAPSKAEA